LNKNARNSWHLKKVNDEFVHKKVASCSKTSGLRQLGKDLYRVTRMWENKTGKIELELEGERLEQAMKA
jgi:hypothetical protein